MHNGQFIFKEMGNIYIKNLHLSIKTSEYVFCYKYYYLFDLIQTRHTSLFLFLISDVKPNTKYYLEYKILL